MKKLISFFACVVLTSCVILTSSDEKFKKVEPINSEAKISIRVIPDEHNQNYILNLRNSAVAYTIEKMKQTPYFSYEENPAALPDFEVRISYVSNPPFRGIHGPWCMMPSMITFGLFPCYTEDEYTFYGEVINTRTSQTKTFISRQTTHGFMHLTSLLVLIPQRLVGSDYFFYQGAEKRMADNLLQHINKIISEENKLSD